MSKKKKIKCYECCYASEKDGKFFCNNGDSKKYGKEITPYTGCEDGEED